ncbi:unnamed protein product [Rotaria magnacalcarata]|uniref:ADP-ribosylarginine hydrolase n=1 Tax=Rotaria magnacalcarata TaxID=392030 RepID=A0A816URG8_9BILA|nr:unnamed protein product [Rotaria magnacalcarata]
MRCGFDPYDQLVRYKCWHKNGYMSSTGKCFAIGSSTRQCLNVFEQRQRDFAQGNKISLEDLDSFNKLEILNSFDINCGINDATDNEGLMRRASVPLLFHQDPKKAVEYSGRSAKIIHGNQNIYDACRYYGALIVAAIQGMAKTELLDPDFYKKHEDWFGSELLQENVRKITEGSYKRKNGYQDDENTFEEGVLAAVNRGDNTDTRAAIYGQLSGTYYGYKELPSRWVEHVYAVKFITCMGKWIAYQSERCFHSNQ